MEPLLEVKHLTKTFKQNGREEAAAVDNLSFCLYPRRDAGNRGRVRIRKEHRGESHRPSD